MTEKAGWTGRSFEDFEVGDLYRHPLGRTVTQADNIWFTLLTVNNNPIHFDSHYAARTEFQRPLVDSTFTLALVTGLSVTDVSMNGEVPGRISATGAVPAVVPSELQRDVPGPVSFTKKKTRDPTG